MSKRPRVIYVSSRHITELETAELIADVRRLNDNDTSRIVLRDLLREVTNRLEAAGK